MTLWMWHSTALRKMRALHVSNGGEEQRVGKEASHLQKPAKSMRDNEDIHLLQDVSKWAIFVVFGDELAVFSIGMLLGRNS